MNSEDKSSSNQKSIKLEKFLNFIRGNQYLYSLTFLVIIFSLFMSHLRLNPIQLYPAGTILQKDIKSPIDFQVIDEKATEMKKLEAKEKVLKVYDYDSEIPLKIEENIRQIFLKGRNILVQLKEIKEQNLNKEDKQKIEKELLNELKNLLDPQITRFSATQIEKDGFSPALEEKLRNLIKKLYQKKIVSDEEDFKNLKAIKIREIRVEGNEWEVKSPSFPNILTLSQAKRYIRDLLDEVPDLSPSLKAASEEFLRTLIKPNLTFNNKETLERINKAKENVQPLVVFIKKGDTIAKANEIVDEALIHKLNLLNEKLKDKINFKKVISLLTLSLLLLCCAFMYFKTYQKAKKIDIPILNFTLIILTLILITSHLLQKLSFFIGEHYELKDLNINETTIFFTPFFIGSAIICLFIDRHIAIIFSILISLFSGLLYDLNFKVSLYAFLSNIFAIYIIEKLRKKRIPIRASLFVGLMNALILPLIFIGEEFIVSIKNLIWLSTLGFLSAFPFGLMIVTTIIPLFENFYNIVTDIRLYELSNLGHPLLQKLAIEAPGTYHHSLMVSHLAEAAATSINANALFCRVASYYHDIGKMVHPEYFIENRNSKDNPHDKLKPEMSALIIKSHVKEGIKIAKIYKLPDKIISIIPEHHGTRKISFFYDRALTIIDPEKDTINESDFCYQGPTPQSKEAAIIMISDAIEASSRTLKDPSSQRIKSMIEEVVDKIVDEGQLSSCELTLKELSSIKESLFKSLAGYFSKRLSYPNFEYDKEEPNGKRESG